MYLLNSNNVSKQALAIVRILAGSGSKRVKHSDLPILPADQQVAHLGNQQEFYQLLRFTGDVDPEAELDEWERFIDFRRLHGAFKGKTPYEALRKKL